MGNLTGNLTNPNTALINPQTQQPTFVGSPSQVLARANAGLPSANQLLGPDVLNPRSSQDQAAMTQNLPRIGQPSFIQAATQGPGGIPDAMSPALSKGGKLLTLLFGGLQGGLAGRAASEQAVAASGGRRGGGIGTGFQAGYAQPYQQAEMPLQLEQQQAQTQMAREQARMYPQLAFLGANKTVSETQKNVAEGQKAGAEAQAVPTKQALEQAQTLAAQWKEEPATGLLRNLSTGQTMNPGAGGMAILDGPSAAVLGKQAGDKVPLKLALQAKQYVDAGVHTMQAGGRSLLVDSSGKTIADKGVATPMAVINATNPFGGMNFPVATGADALKGMTPEQQTLVKKIANYEIDPTQFRTNRNPKAYADLLASVSAYNPNYDQTQYGTKSALRKSFTSGSDSQNIQALNTVAHHLSQLDQANDALGAGNTQLLNKIAQAYHVKVQGQSAPVVFEAIKNAVSGELGSVFKKSGATDSEIANIGSTIQASLAKGINKDVIGTNVGLVEGRLKALQFKYENGMGQPADFKVISPEAEQIFGRLGGPGNQGGIKVTDPQGGVHMFTDQPSADKFKKLAGIQ